MNFLNDITVGSDDTGHDVKFYGATAGKFLHWDESEDYLLFRDSTHARFGSGGDLRIYHDSNNSYIQQGGVGDLHIYQSNTDKDIVFSSDDGSGGETAYITLDGSVGYTTVQKRIRFDDNVFLGVGSGNDFTIDHDGSHTSLQNSTGNLNIKNYADDSDIVFQCDDGSGGVETYFYLDGSNNIMRAEKQIRFVDDAHARFGDSGDLRIYHNATNSYIENYTGNLYFQQTVDDGDMIFTCDDGSGGLTAYLTLDGGLGYTTVQKAMRFADGVALNLGAGNDLSLSHNGTDSNIVNWTGDLYIDNGANDKDIIFKGTDNSGDITALTLDMSDAGTASFNHDALFVDQGRIKMGSGNDMQIYHSGSNAFLTNTEGNINIINHTDDGDIAFQADDGSGGDTTYFYLDGSEVGSYFLKHVHFADSVQLRIGAGNDAAFYHDASDTYLTNGTGDFYIQNTANDKDVIFRCDDGSGGNTAYITLDGSATKTIFNENASFVDGKYLYFGTGSDAHIRHDGSNYTITNTAGDITILNATDDGDIVFQADDGSGGNATYLTLDGGISSLIAYRDILLATDGANGKLKFGASQDLQLYHDGTDSLIKNTTGDLYIKNTTDDGDIKFQADDGSGSDKTYFFLDGSIADGTFAYTIFPDSSMIVMGTSSDMIIGHNATNSSIINYTGNLEIGNNANDKDVILSTDDGSGGKTAYITLDGSAEKILMHKSTVFSGGGMDYGVDGTGADVIFYGDTSGVDMKWDQSEDHLLLKDSAYLKLGTSGDFKMWHDGSNTYLSNEGVGHVYIQNTADDKDIIFKSDNGSGGTTAYLTLDGSVAKTQVDRPLLFVDNISAEYGTGTDMIMYHSGSHGYIENYTGDLKFIQNADDEAIIFQCDDGSGGIETYFQLEGVSGGAAPFTVFPDSSVAAFGSGHDLRIQHDGTDTLFDNYGGHIYFRQQTDDKDIIFQCDDGSGGVTAYLTLDGSGVDIDVAVPMVFGTDGTGVDVTFYGDTAGEYMFWDMSSDALRFQDGAKANFGTGQDLSIQHDGNNSYIDANGTGDLLIQQYTTDKDIIFKCDDGSGGETAYLTLDGSDEIMQAAVSMKFADSKSAYFGGSSDLQIVHDGSNSYVSHIGTGNLVIQNTTDDANISFHTDDGSGGTTEYFRIDGQYSKMFFYENARFVDSKKLYFGTSDDLEIYHDGSNSYISDSGTGVLYIRSGGSTSVTVNGVNTTFAGDITVGDDVFIADSGIINLGSGNDMTLFHDGADAVIRNNTGHIYFDNLASDRDIYFRGSDGGSTITALTLDMSDAGKAIFNTGAQLSGTLTVGVDDTGYDVKFFGATSGKYLLWDESDDRLLFADNTYLALGASSDLLIYHDGSDSAIVNAVGSLYIDNNADDEDIVFRCDDGSGGTATYMTLDGSTKIIELAQITNIPTDTAFRFGHSSTFIEGMTSGSKLGLYGQTDILLRIGGSSVIVMDNAKCEFSIPAIPATSDGVALGSATKMWSDLFLASGGVVNFNNGDVTLTHSSNLLTVAGGNLAATISTAAQTNITSLGTLTALDVDDINLNAKTLTITGDTSDTFTIVAGAAGATTLTTTDGGGAAGHFEVAADGNITLDANGSISFEMNDGDYTSFKNGSNTYAHFFAEDGANTILDIYEKGGESNDDYFRINVGTAGATTLTTHDDTGATAHFEIAADGNITLDAAGSIVLEPGSGSATLQGALSISGDGSNATTFTESGSGTMTIATADDFIVDATGDIVLDAADNDVLFKDAGTHIGTINMSSQNLTMESSVSDKDIIIKGNDGGSVITACTFDMSEAGKATFNNDVVAYSDRRLKENIETLDGKKVLDMRGVGFTRKDTGLPSSGVIAQEIQEVAPELVNETNGTLGVSYGNLVGYLIEAVKDQQKQIDELKERIDGNSKHRRW